MCLLLRHGDITCLADDVVLKSLNKPSRPSSQSFSKNPVGVQYTQTTGSSENQSLIRNSSSVIG
ncbi:hypothetical protein S1OALGB6SA_1468 [Olavius algarvensis spirochete endosymbiont]|nr:hypothetical protein S1OALGB6SA_1468 [Olavius algarvensis spirochete endosymbiont]